MSKIEDIFLKNILETPAESQTIEFKRLGEEKVVTKTIETVVRPLMASLRARARSSTICCVAALVRLDWPRPLSAGSVSVAIVPITASTTRSSKSVKARSMESVEALKRRRAGLETSTAPTYE